MNEAGKRMWNETTSTVRAVVDQVFEDLPTTEAEILKSLSMNLAFKMEAKGPLTETESSRPTEVARGDGPLG